MQDEEKRTFQDKFMLRLPDGMRERIRHAAEANNRSMNAEIVAVLEEKYPAPRNETPAEAFKTWLAFINDAGEPERDSRLALAADAVAHLDQFGVLPPPPIDGDPDP